MFVELLYKRNIALNVLCVECFLFFLYIYTYILFFIYLFTVRHKTWELNPSPVSANPPCSRGEKKETEEKSQGVQSTRRRRSTWGHAVLMNISTTAVPRGLVHDSCWYSVFLSLCFFLFFLFTMFTVNYGVLLLSFRRRRWKAPSHTFFFFFLPFWIFPFCLHMSQSHSSSLHR